MDGPCQSPSLGKLKKPLRLLEEMGRRSWVIATVGLSEENESLSGLLEALLNTASQVFIRKADSLQGGAEDEVCAPCGCSLLS